VLHAGKVLIQIIGLNCGCQIGNGADGVWTDHGMVSRRSAPYRRALPAWHGVRGAAAL
jgi:hypothetical protein